MGNSCIPWCLLLQGQFWLLGGCRAFDGELICTVHKRWAKLIQKTDKDDLRKLLSHFVAGIVDNGIIPRTTTQGYKVIYAFSGKTKWLRVNQLAKYRIEEYNLVALTTTGDIAYETGALPMPDGIRTLRRIKKMLMAQGARERNEKKSVAPVAVARPTTTMRSCGPAVSSTVEAAKIHPKCAKTCATNRALKFTKLGKTSGVTVGVLDSNYLCYCCVCVVNDSFCSPAIYDACCNCRWLPISASGS